MLYYYYYYYYDDDGVDVVHDVVGDCVDFDGDDDVGVDDYVDVVVDFDFDVEGVGVVIPLF